MLLHIVTAVEEPVLKGKLQKLLSKMDCVVQSVEDPKNLWKEISQKIFDVIIISHQVISSNIAQEIRSFKELPDSPLIIVITKDENPQQRAGLLVAGCTAVLSSGLPSHRLGEALNTIIENRQKLALTSLARRRKIFEATLNDFSSRNPAMQEFVRMARQVVNSNSPALILGETGVGKERLAHAIHIESSRSAGPFVAVNCGAMPESLLESELFGHEEGAFTGATRSHRGCFEMAHRGTLFLDEVGEIPVHLQVKLLRVLESREIRRLGSERATGIDVRIMAATNRDLEEAVRHKQFRTDLYYRLNVVALTIPPLRDRREDIPELVEKYILFLRPRVGRNVIKISEQAMEKMVQYSWPGNIRELINVIERAMLLCQGEAITPADLPSAIRGIITSSARALPAIQNSLLNLNSIGDNWQQLPLKELRLRVFDEVERIYLSNLLRSNNGRISLSAVQAGIDRRTLFSKMKKYELLKEHFHRQ